MNRILETIVRFFGLRRARMLVNQYAEQRYRAVVVTPRGDVLFETLEHPTAERTIRIADVWARMNWVTLVAWKAGR